MINRYEYQKGKGVYVGRFSEKDLENGIDARKILNVQKETGLKYINNEIVNTTTASGKNSRYMDVWVCDFKDCEQFK